MPYLLFSQGLNFALMTSYLFVFWCSMIIILMSDQFSATLVHLRSSAFSCRHTEGAVHICVCVRICLCMEDILCIFIHCLLV